MTATFCPRCGTARTSDLRYCGKCAYDFGEDKGYAIVGTRPDASGWSYQSAAPVPVVAEKKGPSPARIIATVVILLVVGQLWFGIYGLGIAAAIAALYVLVAIARS